MDTPPPTPPIPGRLLPHWAYAVISAVEAYEAQDLPSYHEAHQLDRESAFCFWPLLFAIPEDQLQYARALSAGIVTADPAAAERAERYATQWPYWWYDLLAGVSGYETIHAADGHPAAFPCLAPARDAVPTRELDTALAIANYLREKRAASA